MMKVALDHLLWAAPDLDAGSALFERITGIAPVIGGTHPGFGTRNALTSLSDDEYLEIIAPDPIQDLAGTTGAIIAEMARPQMLTFALRITDLEAVGQAARDAGVAVEGPINMSRATPEGGRLDWRVLRLADDRWPGQLPFFIDWKDTPHPARTTSGGCRLDDIYALTPDPQALRRVYSAIGCDVPVLAGAVNGFVATLTGPNGKVVLT